MHLMYPTDEPYLFKKVHSNKEHRLKRRNRWSTVIPENFGERLANLRTRMDLTQEEMVYYLNERCSPEIHVNLRRYQRWEQGKSLKRTLTLDTLETLSAAFHVPVDYLSGANPSLPALWHNQSVLLNPAGNVGNENTDDIPLQLFEIRVRYRAETVIHKVLARQKSTACRLLLEEIPGADILDTRTLPLVERVIS